MTSTATLSKPTLPFPPPVRPLKARRRPYVAALGVVLVGVGALAMVYLTSTLGQTRPVLAVTATLARGQVIGPADIAVVDLPAGPTALKAVPASALDAVVGQVATVEIPAGTLLNPRSYASSLLPAGQESIVGVALTPEQMPTTPLHAGDRVRIVGTPGNVGEIDGPMVEIAATVISTDAGMVGERTIVNLVAETHRAAQLAGLSASGRAALVIDPIAK